MQNPKKQGKEKRRSLRSHLKGLLQKKEKPNNDEKEVRISDFAYCVNELAEQLNMYPSDVEAALKKLQEKGQVKCYMYEGLLYAAFNDDVDVSCLAEDNTGPMFQ